MNSSRVPRPGDPCGSRTIRPDPTGIRRYRPRDGRHDERLPSSASDSPFRQDPTLFGLYVEEAVGRIATILAALTTRPVPDDEDIDWAALPAHSLKGLTAQAGDTDLADEVHSIEDSLAELRGTADPAARRDAAGSIVTRLQAIETTLTGEGAPAVRDIDLARIADAISAEIQRVASRRGVHVGVDLVVPRDTRIARRAAGVLIDALGHVARNAVAHGTPHGGTIRAVFTHEPEVLVIVLSDHGARAAGDPAGERAPDRDSGRGIGLRAAQARLMAIGGDLSVASGAWGGTSVTIRVPA